MAATIYNRRLKMAALAAYSDGKVVCTFCGYDNPDALSLDHVDNNGAQWRRSRGVTGGQNTYHLLAKEGYPSGFQVLCMNCNTLKEVRRRKSE